MTEYYLANDFALGELPRVGKAGTLLAWADTIAAGAQGADIYRDKEGRKTLRFEYRGKRYFLKLHSGIGWLEIIKNLLQLRLPVVSASKEYHAVLALQRAGVFTLTIVAFARAGWNPAVTRSMIVTPELAGTVSLEQYCAGWATAPPAPSVRMGIVRAVADSARRMHGAGINHRDFYLCHFHLDELSLHEREVRCYLIDLHRAQIRGATPRRWRVKDLAGLYFSAMDIGLARRDLLRFLWHYSGGDLGAVLGRDRGFWRQVERRATKQYVKAHGAGPPALTSLGRQRA